MSGEYIPFTTDAPITGNWLIDDAVHFKPTSTPIAEGFLYEKKIHMIYADPACGKSTLALQAACELAKGVPVFESIPVPRPFKVYYFAFEGDREETMERVHLINERINMTYEDGKNLVIDDCFKGRSCMKDTDVAQMFQRIEQFMFGTPDLIILDPIYCIIHGSLTKEENIMEFCNFSNRLQSKFDCAILYLHHTPKEVMDRDGNTKRRETFFGSQFFRAHCNAMFYLKDIDKDHGRTALICTKQRNSNMLSEIPLYFNPETHSVHVEIVEDADNRLEPWEKIQQLLFKSTKLGLGMSVYDLYEKAKISRVHAHRILMSFIKKGLIICRKKDKKNTYFWAANYQEKLSTGEAKMGSSELYMKKCTVADGGLEVEVQ